MDSPKHTAARLARKHGYRLRSIWTMLVGFDDPIQTIRLFAGRSKPVAPVVRLRHGELEFRVRGAFDTWCLKETLLDRCYERYGFAIQPGWTIVDVGAGIGDFTVLAASADGSSVHAFEPFGESFALLAENLARNGITAALHQRAVTGRSRRLVLDRSSGEPLMFESIDATVAGSGDLVSSITLEDALAEFSIATIDLLKLDCEGAEYDILMQSSPGVLARVARIVVEVHDGVTRHSREELGRFLRNAGYTVEMFPSPVHPGQLAYLRAARDAGQEE